MIKAGKETLEAMGVLEILAEKLKDCKDLLKYVNKLSGVDKNREKLEKLAKVLDDFPDAKVLDELVKKLDLEDIDDFIADLVGNKQLQDLFKDEPELVEAWEVLVKYPKARINPAQLKFFVNNDVKGALSWIEKNKPNLLMDYPDLSVGEITALNYYTTNTGTKINYWLRKQADEFVKAEDIIWSDEFSELFTNQLENAFEKLPHYSSNSNFLRLENRSFSEVNSILANLEIKYPNFISVSKDNKGSFIDGFLNRFIEDGGQNFIFEIRNITTSKAIDIEPFSVNPFEREVLIMRNKSMMVIDSELKPFPIPTPEEFVANSSVSITLEDARKIIKEELDAWRTSKANPNAISYDKLAPEFYSSPEYVKASAILTIIVDIID